MVMDYSEFKAFDNLNTEIIILDGDAFKLLWINDAAKAANWIGDSSKFSGQTISSLLNKETGFQINEILKKTRKNSGSVTRRDFEIIYQSGIERTVDLTITFSEKKNLIFTYKYGFLYKKGCLSNPYRYFSKTRTLLSLK